MQRTVSSHLSLSISGTTEMVFSIAVAKREGVVTERLDFVLDGEPIEATELVDARGTRLHRLVSGPGTMEVDYRAELSGREEVVPHEPLDPVTFLRPSRYCQSDGLTPTARSEFFGLRGVELLEAVTEWVWQRIRYTVGGSLPTDGAEQTLLSRRGVCRDFAHLVIALLRALDVPARMVSVYAPGLSPMDFHAVVEAWIDGEWLLVDATRLAPRESMVRIATGRDAADTAFLTNHWADLTLDSLNVLAVVDSLPIDDGRSLARLG